MRRIICVALLAVGCASGPLRHRALPRLPDGKLDVIRLLQAAHDGIEDGCASGWLTLQDCDAVHGMIADAERDASQGRSIAVIEERLLATQARIGVRSHARPYVQWLLTALAKEP